MRHEKRYVGPMAAALTFGLEPERIYAAMRRGDLVVAPGTDHLLSLRDVERWTSVLALAIAHNGCGAKTNA